MERTPQTHYWVGGTDQKEEGKWLWSDGNPWNFTLWAKEPRQPDNHYPGENCLKIYDHVTPDGWNDDVCRKDHKFVCSQRICQNLKDDTSPADSKDVPILFTALSSGLILVLIVASTIGFLGSRRSKTKKEETMDLDESHVYESNTALMRLMIQMIIRDNKLLNKI